MGQTEYIVCPLCFRNRVRRPQGTTWQRAKESLPSDVVARKDKPGKAGEEVRFDTFDCSAGFFSFTREWGGKIPGERVGRGKAEPKPPVIVGGLTLAQAAQRPEYAPLIAQLRAQLREIDSCLS